MERRLRFRFQKGLTLDSTLTDSLNSFNDATTITQSAAGADIIITVPKGSGKQGWEGQNGYQIAGSYDVTQTADDQTLTAAGPIQFSQVISVDGATLDGTGSTMSETIAGTSDVASVSGISVSIGGNSYGAGAQNQLTLSTDPADATSYLATYGLSSMIASALTDDAVVTISVPDGIKMSSLTVPDSGANSSQYLTGTTQYSYTVTLADGTTQEGVVDAGGEITAAAGTTIRSIALTPNYLSSGAYTVGANHGTDSGFVLSGSVSQTYDNGNAVQVGDEINFGISVALASDPTTVVASQTYTETISVPIDGVYAYMWQPADGQVAGKVYAGRISVGGTGGNKHTTDNVYEPTFYYVLPSGTSIYGMSGISDDAKVTEYLSDDGRTVVEVDYSGTGESVNTDSTGPVQIDLSNNPDALPGEYPFSMYVYSPTTALTNGTKVTDTSYTNGNADAYLMIGGDMNWTISSASVFDEYSFAQGNQDVTGISAGTSDDQGTDDATFYTTLINTVADGADNTATSVINLPTDGDASGSGYTFDLTGPVTLPTNYITSTGTGDAVQGTVLYSTSAQTVTNGQAAPDTTGYVTADEIGDNWSSVRSIMIEVDNVAKGTSTGRIAINGTIENMENLAGQTGYLSTAVFVNGNSASTEAKAASIAITGTSSVTTRFHYVDADGNDQYITLDDLAQNDLQDNVDTLKDIYPTSLDGFSAADQALIPEGYTLASDDYTLVSGPNADGIESTATTKVGDTAIYSTDGEIVQYELAKSADLTVTYVDDDNGGSTVGDVATVSGVLGTSGSYQTTTPTGYDLASGQASTLVYTLTDDDTDNLTVHLVHNITTTGTVTTTNTVTYTGLPADKTPATQTADVTWTIETDDVTGQTTYVPSTAGTTTYQTTNVAGYSFDPSQAEVSFTTASQSDAPTDQNTEVAYTADKQGTDIEFVDDDENGASVGDPTALNGTTDQAVDWTAAVPDNYDLAKNQSASGTYTFQATDNAPIVIHLVHQHTTTSMTTTDTVSYTGLPSDKTVSDNSATVNWNVDTDQVTNTVTYTTATPTTEIASPTVTGYTAADPSVTFTQSASTTTEPVDQQQTVNYTPNATSFTVSYVDDDNGDAQVGQPATVNGATDETGEYTIDVPAGYQLAAQQDVTIGADNTVAYTLPTDNMTIHLTHKHAVSTTTTTNTVTYAGLPETKTPSDDVSTVTWNVDTDEATDTTVYTPDNATTTVSVPTIDGYTASANEVTFTQGTTPENQTKTVTYTADPESLTVTYVDDDSSDEAQVGNTVTLTGNMDDTGTYTVTVPTGYALTAGQTEISDANTIAYTLTNDDSDNLTIHLSHVHTSSTVTTTDTVTYTGLPADKAQTPKTVAVDWTVDTDEATGQSTYTPTATSTVIDSPMVDGYAPASTTTDFSQETITDAPTDQTATVAYTATGQTLTVTYVDDTTGNTLTTMGGTLAGVTDETGTYTVQVPTNYVLSDGQTAEVAYTFTTDNTDNLTIHLSHGIATGTATTTRNVYFVVQGDNALNPVPVQQTAMWNVTEDLVTGAVTATTTDSYGQVYTPAVSGYTASTTTVPSETLGTINTLPTNAEDVFVTYAADPQTASVEYIDDDNGGATVGTPTTINGVTGTTTDWNTTDLPTGYHLVTGQAASGTYEFTADDDQVVQIHVAHTHTQSSLTTQDTVSYEGLPTDKAQTAKSQSVTWDIDTDEATGTSTYTPETAQTAIESPDVDGYTADQTTVSFDQVSDTTAPENQSKTVTYTADPQALTVTYIDDATGETMAALDTILTGTTDETGTYTVSVPTNYVLSQGQSASVGYTYTTDNTDDITVHLTHAIADGTTTTTRTIYNVVEGDNSQNPTPTTQNVTWKVERDMVTGSIVATAEGDYEASDSPEVSGYTPDQATVAAETLGAIDTQPTDTKVYVAYTADPATEKVTYIDDATGEEMPTLDTTIDGYTGMKGTYDVTVPNNYVLGQGQSAEVAYTMQPGETALTIHLNHMIVDGTATTTRTITYVVPGDPSAAPKTVTQNITWKVVRDMVTGSSYATAQNGYDEVDTPTLVGYTADKPSVAQELFGNEPTSDLADSTVVVTYTANPVAPDNGGNGGDGSDGGTPTSTGTDSSTPGNDTATDNDGDTVSGNGKSGDSGDTTTSSSSHGDTVTHGHANENSSVITTANGDATTGKQETTNRTLSGTLTTSSADTSSDKSANDTANKTSKLPQTSEQQSGVWAIAGASLMGLLGLIGFGKKKREDD